jgi:serine/threonine protein kinase
MNNMIEAVDDLHKAGYVHNDIRPSNIYYSDIKQSFVLGSFSNVKYANLLQ